MSSLQTKTPPADLAPLPNGQYPANGSPLPVPDLSGHGAATGPRQLPSQTARKGRRWTGLLVALGLGGAAAIYGGFLYLSRTDANRPDVLTHTVKREPLNLTVTEKGTLESANNHDVVCKVRAGSKGFASSINWVVDDGTLVKKGQLLMVLDDSDFQDRFRTQKVLVDQKFSEKTFADEQYVITLKTNEIEIATAEANVAIAEINLEQYTGIKADESLLPLAAVVGGPGSLVESGLYKQQYDDFTGQLRLAESETEQSRERSAWADRMVKMRYMSPAQAQAERSRLESSLEKLRSVQAQRQILQAFTRRVELTTRLTALENAIKALDKAKKQAQAMEIQADIDRKTKHSIYLQELDKLKEIEDQIRECKITAPQSGMVVYYKAESGRFSNNSNTGLIEQGAQVKEGQKLLRIPDLGRMQVNTKVHEAMVSRIHGDVRRSTGFFDAMRAALLVNPNALTRWVSLQDDFLDSMRSNHRDRENYISSRGQRATVRVDAIPNRSLSAHVRSVAQVASQQDFFSSDVKLYPTLVLIDEVVDGLKPDMTAEVTIHVDSAATDVLTVPLQAVMGGAEMGATRKVFVRTATGYEERDVKLGLANERVVEVREGIKEGDEVVINPKTLRSDGVKTADVAEARPDRGGKESGKGGPPAGGDPTKAPGKKKKGSPPAPPQDGPTQ